MRSREQGTCATGTVSENMIDLHEVGKKSAVSRAWMEEQLRAWRESRPPVLLKPALLGDGIMSPGGDVLSTWEGIFEEARGRKDLRLACLVPAAGAASRMMQPLREYLSLEAAAVLSSPLLSLERGMQGGGIPWLDVVERARWKQVDRPERQAMIRELLYGPEGLESRPKGLLPFHAQRGGTVDLAVDEHLRRLRNLGWKSGTLLHLCVDERHLSLWRSWQEETDAGDQYQPEIGFSFQDPESRTMARDTEERVLVNDAGDPVLRPGGHGALLPNLGRLAAWDLVSIRNIDNVSHADHDHDAEIWRKRMLGGMSLFLSLRNVFLRNPGSREARERVSSFLEPFLAGHLPDLGDSLGWVNFLDRPVRLCAMVPQRGEPGGGPFWISGLEGRRVLRIVEACEISPREEQQNLLRQSTHFNPVDMICSMRDAWGRPYDLTRFRDDRSWMKSVKRDDSGREIQILELPGLWNGGMSHWLSLFVAVPETVFAPVKSILDLLRPEHQPGRRL